LSAWVFFAVFAFVLLGARILLALVVIYFLTPQQSRCIGCDGETITVEPARGLVGAARALRLESRWCTRCGRTTLTRSPGPPLEPRGRRLRTPRHDHLR
jgi:hypothetical protein